MAIRGRQDQALRQAWYAAALSRQKKLVSLDKLLGRKRDMNYLKDALRRVGRERP